MASRPIVETGANVPSYSGGFADSFVVSWLVFFQSAFPLASRFPILSFPNFGFQLSQCQLFFFLARASRSGVKNNPDRDGLATVWTPAAFDGLAYIRHESTIACEDLDVFGDGWSDLGVVSGDQASNWC